MIMKFLSRTSRVFSLFGVAASIVLASSASAVQAQEAAPVPTRGILSGELQKSPAGDRMPAPSAAGHNANIPYNCVGGPVRVKTDVGYEGVKYTSFNWSSTAGGGESGRFDKTPVLTTRVNLANGTCLNAHLSALVGSKKTYGVAALTMFQVTLTPMGGTPRHMFGHYEIPYGIYGPAVFTESENDVDTLAANFFQPVGKMQGGIAPGIYRVDVWWSGGPIGGGGAIGAAFVLSLYQT
jgi:hypothetical protein